MKLTRQESWRVEIEVTSESEGEEIRRQVIRHCDVNKWSVSLKWNTVNYCSFCGRDPEEDEEGPWCCTPAQEEWTIGRNMPTAAPPIGGRLPREEGTDEC